MLPSCFEVGRGSYLKSVPEQRMPEATLGSMQAALPGRRERERAERNPI